VDNLYARLVGASRRDAAQHALLALEEEIVVGHHLVELRFEHRVAAALIGDQCVLYIVPLGGRLELFDNVVVK
jgi:hypothetical protein